MQLMPAVPELEQLTLAKLMEPFRYELVKNCNSQNQSDTEAGGTGGEGVPFTCGATVEVVRPMPRVPELDQRSMINRMQLCMINMQKNSNIQNQSNTEEEGADVAGGAGVGIHVPMWGNCRSCVTDVWSSRASSPPCNESNESIHD
jgi:hypothetical protein